ncbi:bifunctional DNA primase/polymerase [Streptomyces sp. NBC_00654]|uniref:bifunctional DNA primase/polymerase n=1 Tax=Streptomyces sp. NBC_00654 TaxID=2975799 RepID=UPI0022562F9A|nr:bifunctional DNA primase/polymerase [Streptomyces sp. NBC_00654]MCX4969541.1 bifunctional DNA primase/polymerase [Streptomyces sp. NBC_00654]
MSAWLQDETTRQAGAAAHHGVDIFALLRDHAAHQTAQITAAGAAWLAGATSYPRSTLSQWEARPGAPGVLPCGSAFDVVNVPALFGRRMLERLWAEGPGSGPVATHRGRMLLFAAPGTAQRLPSLLAWEEWGGAAAEGPERHPEGHPEQEYPQERAVPPLLCHGTGDAVTVPPLTCAPRSSGPRWVVAPDTRNPWLPGPDVMLWACVRVGRSAPLAATGNPIFPPADPDANVYDVSRRR